MLKYKELNKHQKEFICNGCGSKGGWIKVPNFIFKASCNQHDFYYWRGGSEEDRTTADYDFFEAMKEDVKEKPYLSRWFYYTWAYTYHGAVRSFGAKAFSFSNHKKTMSDLLYGMRRDVV